MKRESAILLIGLCLFVLLLSDVGQRAYRWGFCNMVLRGAIEQCDDPLPHKKPTIVDRIDLNTMSPVLLSVTTSLTAQMITIVK